MLINLLLLSILGTWHVGYAASTPTMWLGSSDYQSGNKAFANPSGSTIMTYDTAFSSTPKKMLLAYNSIVASSSAVNFQITLIVINTGAINAQVDWNISGSVGIANFVVRYMVVSSSISWLSCNSVNFTAVTNCVNLITGSGVRTCDLIGNFTSGTGQVIDISHTNVMLIWPQTLWMNTVGNKDYSFKWSTQFININEYKITLTLYGNTTLPMLTYCRLIYDLTAIQADHQIYLDGGDQNAYYSNYTQLRPTFLYSSPNSFMIGLSSWTISQTEIIDFKFTVGNMTASGTMDFGRITLSYWNYRFRTCPADYPLYSETLDLCYDQCPGYTYKNTTSQMCLDCYFTCYNCWANTSSSCTYCSASDFRWIKNNKCQCMGGYYETGARVCGVCNFKCGNCSISAGNCTTCPIGSGRAPSGNTCLCQPPLIESGLTNCLNCTVVMPGCSTCSSASVCISCNTLKNFTASGSSCVCKTGTYFSVDHCEVCSQSIVGCTSCSSSAVCNTCNAAEFFQLLTNKCVCISKFFNSSNICAPCSSAIQGCDICSSASSCTICNAMLFFETNGNTCKCITGYYLDLGVCKLCSDVIPGCTSCTSSIHCVSCDPGNFFVLQGLVCVCPLGRYSNATTNMCEVCSAMPYCQSCINSTNCTSCLYSSNTVASGGVCISCSNLIPGCQSCSTPSICDTCKHFLLFEENGAGSCQCISIAYLNITSQCQLCSQHILGCVECDSSHCTTCNASQYFKLSGTVCVCQYKYFLVSNTCLNCSMSCLCAGYYNTTGTCLTICGDGIWTEDTEGCDDGNTDDRDGCSNNCQMEPDFSCQLNGPGANSLCTYTKPLQLEIQNITKDPMCNCVTIVVNIGPNITTLNDLNFSNVVTPNFNYSSQNYIYNNGTLTIVYTYNHTLNDDITLTIDPSSDTHFSQVPNSTVKTDPKSINNQPLVIYQDSTYQESKSFDSIFTVILGASYVLFILSMFTNKVVGIEMMGVVQIAFFALASMDFLTPLMSPLAKIKEVNGFNLQYDHAKGVPISIMALDYNSNFTNNINIMLVFPTACLMVSGIMFLLSRTSKLGAVTSVNMLSWSKNLVKQYFLTSTMFSLYNISFSTALFVRYNSLKEYLVTNIVGVLVSNSFVLVLLYCLMFTPSLQFGEYKNKLKSNLMSRNYFVISITYRYILGFLLGFFNCHGVIAIVNTFLSALFVVYLLSNLPFRQAYHNYRGVVCEGSTTIILWIAMYYKSMKQNTNLGTKARILEPAYLEIVVILVCIGVSGGVLVHEVVETWKRWRKGTLHDKWTTRNQTVTQDIIYNDPQEASYQASQ